MRSKEEAAVAKSVTDALKATAEWRASKEPQVIGIMQSGKISRTGEKEFSAFGKSLRAVASLMEYYSRGKITSLESCA